MLGMSKHGRPGGFTFLNGPRLDIKVAHNDKDRALETTSIIIDKENVLNRSITTKA